VGEQKTPVTVSEIEELLMRLVGVISAKVVVNDWGGIEEIHVLSSMDRSPKQVVRDIESSLAAQWGIAIDHKKISVAQLTGVNAQVASPRVVIRSVEVANDMKRNSLTAKVTLVRSEDADTEYVGESAGSAFKGQAGRLAAYAGISAVNSMLREGYMFNLEGLETTQVGGNDVTLVQVVLLTPRGREEISLGAVFTRGDPAESAVRAVLDAVNRKLTKLPLKRKKDG